MSKERIRNTLGIILIIIGFIWVLYLIFKIKGFAGTVGSLSDEQIKAAIGLTIVLGWWVNGAAHKTVPIVDSFTFSSPSDPSLLQKWRPWSLTFAAADAQAFRYLILWTGETINFAISSVFGVIFGSLIAALYTRTFNWVAPTLQQFKYNLVGGLLMGFGAIVAMGCNRRVMREL